LSGIGEDAARVRSRMSAWFGLELDAAVNRTGGPRISKADADVSAWVIPTDENLMIARHAVRLLRL